MMKWMTIAAALMMTGCAPDEKTIFVDNEEDLKVIQAHLKGRVTDKMDILILATKDEETRKMVADRDPYIRHRLDLEPVPCDSFVKVVEGEILVVRMILDMDHPTCVPLSFAGTFK